MKKDTRPLCQGLSLNLGKDQKQKIELFIKIWPTQRTITNIMSADAITYKLLYLQVLLPPLRPGYDVPLNLPLVDLAIWVVVKTTSLPFR